TGQGVSGTVDQRNVSVGSADFVDAGSLREQAERLRRDGQTVVLIAIDNRPAGLLGISDPIKSTSKEAIEALHRDGIEIIMLTGDNRVTAEAVARQLGIAHVEAEVLPDQKVNTIERLQAE